MTEPWLMPYEKRFLNPIYRSYYILLKASTYRWFEKLIYVKKFKIS